MYRAFFHLACLIIALGNGFYECVKELEGYDMGFFLDKLWPKEKLNDCFIIVSGLPRSGTSMMMRMIEAGGLPVVTDKIRKADEDNPRGYYEFEKVKKIKQDASWLDDCRGRVFKMVSELLYHLPKDKKYKIIFMKREITEILASQKLMLERRGEKGAGVSNKKMAALYEKHLRSIESWLEDQENIDALLISYNDVNQQPGQNAKTVNKFLGGDLNAEKMAGVVETSLYRQKKKIRID
jgi:hypothetical protein